MRRGSLTPKWAHFLFHTSDVASLTPIWRRTSATAVPLSACRSA